MKMKKQIKNLMLFIFCTVLCSLCIGNTAKAEEVKRIQCGPNAYAVLDDLGTLTITGSGEMYDSNDELAALRNEVYNLKIGDGITYIGEYSFQDFDNMQSVSIGKGVKKIGYAAFYGCSGNMFTDLVIPSNVQEIGGWAFYNCSNLKNLTLQTGLKKIDERAFLGCENLKNISLPNGISSVEPYAFWNCGLTMQIVIPENIGAIKENAFGYDEEYYENRKYWSYNSSATVTIYTRNAMLAQDCFNFASTTIKCYRGTTAEKYAKQHNDKCEYIGVDSTLYFNANGGKCGVSSKRVTSEYCYGELPVPTRAGYIFKGWYTKQSGGSKISNETIITQEKNTTIYAHWTKLNVAKTTIKKLSNQANKKITISLKKVSGAKGYEVQYGKNRKMQKAKTKRKATATITIGSLKKGTTYYVRARAYKIDSQGKRVYGAWSGTKKIKVKK